MQNIAIDLGYGSVKLITNKSMCKFPSAVSPVKRSLIEPTETLYQFNGLNYIVGDDAVSDAYGTRDYSFMEKFAPLLTYKALKDLGVDFNSPINLATGLSLLNWDKKERFAQALQNIVVNNEHVDNIELSIYPQGKGIFVDCLKNHPRLTNELVMVVDIGYNTLDVIPFKNGKALSKDAFANTFGVNKIIQELSKYIVSMYNLSLNEAEVNEVFQNKYLTVGTRKDLTMIIDEEKQKYIDQICQIIKSHNNELFTKTDTIIIAGGGAYTFDNFEFADKNVIFPKGEYEYSNVRGYYESLING